jgi:predicted AAA+ superfamily ATPase
MDDNKIMYYPRALKKRWFELSDQFPVLLLTGPRQVGKTTFLHHISEPTRQYVTLDDPDIRLLANKDPVLFFRRYKTPILIDEIQYAPGLLPYIKMEADQQKNPGDFWLTGSQQFQMMRGITETLAGRAAILNLLGFSGRERNRAELDVPPFLPLPDLLEKRSSFDWPQQTQDLYTDLWQGSFPALVSGQVRDREIFYSSYLRTYLERDVRDLAQIGDEASFLTFLKACAARTAQILNLSELARDADVSVKTAKKWLSILQASFQVFLLPPYFSNVTKRLVKRPKLYFLDTGLCAYLTDWTTAGALAAGAMSGAILETYVFGEIMKSWWNQAREPSIYYYRDKDCVEIDFVIVQDQMFYPIEVKKAATPKTQWTESFTAIRRIGKIDHGGVVCLCREYLPLNSEISAIPARLI